MSCPICDNKPANCDCGPEEVALHKENLDLRAERDRYRAALEMIGGIDMEKSRSMPMLALGVAINFAKDALKPK